MQLSLQRTNAGDLESVNFDPSLYDFETVFEDAWAIIMDVAGLKAATPRTSNVFQKERPRVEGMFEAGVAKQSYHIVSGQLRNASWQGQFEVVIITQTQTDDQSSTAHRVFRAGVRNLMAGLKDTINFDDLNGNHYLPYHQIQNIVETGITPIYKHSEGYESSKITYRVDFGVRAYVWADSLLQGFFGSGAVDPFFGTSGYQMNNPTRGPSGPTLLTWTVPDLSQEVLIASVLNVNVNVWVNTINDFPSAKLNMIPRAGANFYAPPLLYYWGVTGNVSDYTSDQLATLTAYHDSGGDRGIGCTQGAALGSGHAITFVGVP